MPVTITAIDTIQLSIPLDTWAPPPLFAGKPRTHVEAIYVRVTTSSGVVGWGESFGSSGAAGRRCFRPMDPRPRRRQGPDRQRSDAGHRTPVARPRPRRAGDACALRPRHRAVGHPRQARRRLGVQAARRREAKARRDLRVAAAVLRQRRAREAQHHARARARLQAHQAARAHRRSGRGLARGRRSRHSDHGRHQLRLDCRTRQRPRSPP